MIPSLFIEHDIDSFYVWLARDQQIEKLVAERVGNDKIKRPIWKMVEIMKRILPPLKWEHIASAISHEMTAAVARDVMSLSSSLGPLDENSGDKLLNAFKTETNRKFTIAETRYLQSMMTRYFKSEKHCKSPIETS